jgi:foldase protein PrsA
MKRMKTFSKKALAVLLSAALVGGLAACGASGTAATVNGVKIPEKDVTARIEIVRNGVPDYQDDAMWAAALKASNSTPESMREQYIRDIAREIVLYQAAEQEGLKVDEQAVSDQVAQMKQNVAGEDADAWKKYLTDNGYGDEQGLHDRIAQQDLITKLQQLKSPDEPASEEQIREYVLANAKNFASKRSSQIFLPITEDTTAEAVLNKATELITQLRDGADFAELAKANSQNENAQNGGDMGWSSIIALPNAYVSALDAMQVGGISDPVQSELGVHIIKCTAEYTIPIGEEVDYASIPQEIVSYLSTQAAGNVNDSKYQEYVSQLLAAADIKINPMPKSVPYNVNMSLADGGDVAEPQGEPAAEEPAGETEAPAEQAAEEASAETPAEQPAETEAPPEE